MDSSNMSDASYENSLDKEGECFYEQDFEKFVQYGMPVIYSLLFLFSLSLNAMVLFFITFRTKHWTPSTIYMLNLSMCDTLYVLTLPLIIYNWIYAWPFGKATCKIFNFLFQANHYGSILFLSAISLHRFIGICYPVRSLSWNSARRAKLASVGVWACVLAGQAPVIYFSGTAKYDNSSFCSIIADEELTGYFLVYGSVISVVMFVLPFMLVMVCYGLMVRKLLEPSWGSGEGQQGLQAAHHTKQKSVKMIIIVLVTFLLCFLPYHLVEFWRHIVIYHPEEMTCKQWATYIIAFQGSWLISSANCIMDPILYFMAGQDFRETMKKKHKKLQNTFSECENTVLTTSL